MLIPTQILIILNILFRENDDAIRSIKLITSKLADAILEGKQLEKTKLQKLPKIEKIEAKDAGVTEEVKPKKKRKLKKK